MSEPVCRVGDVVTGICEAHESPRDFTGVWVTGSDTVFNEGLGVIRVGDLGITDCDHIFYAATGSDITDEEGLAYHRVGDVVLLVEGGVGVSVTGSDTLESE